MRRSMVKLRFRPAKVVLVIAAALVAVAFSGLSAAEADEVSLNATNVKVVRNGNVVTVTALVVASNPNRSPVVGLELIEADGSVIMVGNVPAKGTKRSAAFTFTQDLSNYPSHTLVLPVTLRYALNGAVIEKPWGLGIRIAK